MTTTKVIIGGIIASTILIFLCLFFNAERYYKVLNDSVNNKISSDIKFEEKKIIEVVDTEDILEAIFDSNSSNETLIQNEVNSTMFTKEETLKKLNNYLLPPSLPPSSQNVLIVDEAIVGETPEINKSFIPEKVSDTLIDKELSEIKLLQKNIFTLLEKSQITFKKNSRKIDKEGRAVLDKIILLLSDRDNIFLEIQGHTDAGGQRKVNRKISQLRANSVKKYLIKGGFVSKYIDALGFGESTLLLPDDRYNPRNRRVEIYIKRR